MAQARIPRLVVRIERFLIGIGMTAFGWLLERAVLKSFAGAARPQDG